MPRGKLIALEGIDGSGKHTQMDLLARTLEARRLPVLRIAFPRYESRFGQLAGRYLNGDFGPLGAVDPHLAALVYAGDRFEAKGEIESALAAGRIVLADRYIASNLAHQGERVLPEKREEFFAWLKQIEYGVYGLPVEDLVLYLRLPAAQAHRLIGLKAARSYTSRRHDILEADVRHLEHTALIYDRLATGPNWVRINCTDQAEEILRSPEEIHRALLEAVESRVLSQGAAKP